MNTIQTTSLYFKEGGSDKVYIVNLVKNDAGYLVVCDYGRRGNTLQQAVKTNSPVDFATATRIFNKTVNGKKADNYLEGDAINGVVSIPDSGEVKQSGLRPQLLNSIDVKDVMAYINDDAFMAQEKYDGVRLMVQKTDSIVQGLNKRGLITSLAKTIHDAFGNATDEPLLSSFIVDGEAIGDHYYVFDMLDNPFSDCSTFGAEARFFELMSFTTTSDYIHIVDSAFTREEKLAMYNRIKDAGGEGIVFKLKSALYTAGRPNSGGAQLKYKFVESASCIVTAINPSKRSVAISLYDNGVLTDVGNVTIPPNKEVPNERGIVEVQYLYAYRKGSLIQPVYLGARDDVGAFECDVSQLKYKQEMSVA